MGSWKVLFLNCKYNHVWFLKSGALLNLIAKMKSLSKVAKAWKPQRKKEDKKEKSNEEARFDYLMFYWHLQVKIV